MQHIGVKKMNVRKLKPTLKVVGPYVAGLLLTGLGFAIPDWAFIFCGAVIVVTGFVVDVICCNSACGRTDATEETTL